jgi:hypothetical protein
VHCSVLRLCDWSWQGGELERASLPLKSLGAEAMGRQVCGALFVTRAKNGCNVTGALPNRDIDLVMMRRAVVEGRSKQGQAMRGCAGRDAWCGSGGGSWLSPQTAPCCSSAQAQQLYLRRRATALAARPPCWMQGWTGETGGGAERPQPQEQGRKGSQVWGVGPAHIGVQPPICRHFPAVPRCAVLACSCAIREQVARPG